MKTKITPALNKRDVVSVYSGRNGKCCCGCAGKHSTSPAQITRVVNIINERIAHCDPLAQNSRKLNHASAVVGNRLYIAYVADRGFLPITRSGK